MSIESSEKTHLTGPQAMVQSWETRSTSANEKYEEAQEQAVARVMQLINFVRKTAIKHPSMQSLLRIMAGDKFDEELLQAHISHIVENDPDAFGALVLIEQTIARETPINVHEDLAPLRTIIHALKP